MREPRSFANGGPRRGAHTATSRTLPDGGSGDLPCRMASSIAADMTTILHSMVVTIVIKGSVGARATASILAVTSMEPGQEGLFATCDRTLSKSPGLKDLLGSEMTRRPCETGCENRWASRSGERT